MGYPRLRNKHYSRYTHHSTVMGPEPETTQHKFSLDNPPSIDGRGNQSEYRRAVMRWCEWHDAVKDDVDSHRKKKYLSLKERGMALYGKLGGHARVLADTLETKDLLSDKGVAMLLDIIDDINPTNKKIWQTGAFLKIFRITRYNNENLLTYFERLKQAVGNVKREIIIPNFSLTVTPELTTMLAILALHQSGLQESELRQVLSTAITTKIDDESTLITLDAIEAGFVLLTSIHGTKTVTSGYGSNSYPNGGNVRKQNNNQERIKKKKQNSTCNTCGLKGHWFNDPECKGRLSMSGAAEATTLKDHDRGQPNNAERKKRGGPQSDPLRIVSSEASIDSSLTQQGSIMIDSGAPLSIGSLEDLTRYCKDTHQELVIKNLDEHDPDGHSFGVKNSDPSRFIGKARIKISPTNYWTFYVTDKPSDPLLLGHDYVGDADVLGR